MSPCGRYAGKNCEALDAADGCLGGICCNGICTDGLSSFSCDCLPGWYGVDCSGRLEGQGQANFRADHTGTAQCKAFASARHEATFGAGRGLLWLTLAPIAPLAAAPCAGALLLAGLLARRRQKVRPAGPLVVIFSQFFRRDFQ